MEEIRRGGNLPRNSAEYDEERQFNIRADELKWLEDIPQASCAEEEFIPYTLQIANAIRILKNDAVFIFDEVGCGKTISAGIMAKSYLYHNRKHRSIKDGLDQNKNHRSIKDVLVITTDTVKHNGQFGDDWKKIDPELEKVTVWNNRAGNCDLKNLKSEEKWGLVIIDEAHEFHNQDNERHKLVKERLRAEKVVFLTATPLRGGGDFSFYRKLANAILGRDEDYPIKELDELNNLRDIDGRELICARFDPFY